MVIARIAGFSPGTSPPPVRTPITPFLVLMFAILDLSPRGLTCHLCQTMPNRSQLTDYSEAVESTQIELTERKRLIRDNAIANNFCNTEIPRSLHGLVLPPRRDHLRLNFSRL